MDATAPPEPGLSWSSPEVTALALEFGVEDEGVANQF